MATFRDINQYRAEMKTRMRKGIRKAKNNTAKASIYLAGQLKSTGPIKTGKLVKSVRRRPLKNGYSVLAGYSKGNFNVGRYINMELNDQLAVRKYPFQVNATSRVNPWFTKNVEKTIKRYRASYKGVRMALRGK